LVVVVVKVCKLRKVLPWALFLETRIFYSSRVKKPGPNCIAKDHSIVFYIPENIHGGIFIELSLSYYIMVDENETPHQLDSGNQMLRVILAIPF
jgi:hypothetical protein